MTVETRYRDELVSFEVKLLELGGQFSLDVLEHSLRPFDTIHLVDQYHKILDALSPNY